MAAAGQAQVAPLRRVAGRGAGAARCGARRAAHFLSAGGHSWRAVGTRQPSPAPCPAGGLVRSFVVLLTCGSPHHNSDSCSGCQVAIDAEPEPFVRKAAGGLPPRAALRLARHRARFGVGPGPLPGQIGPPGQAAQPLSGAGGALRAAEARDAAVVARLEAHWGRPSSHARLGGGDGPFGESQVRCPDKTLENPHVKVEYVSFRVNMMTFWRSL